MRLINNMKRICIAIVLAFIQIAAYAQRGSIGKGKSLPIGVVTKYYVNKTFLSYNLSEELRSEVNQDFEYQKWRIKRLTEASDNSGSSFNMSVLVWAIVTLLCLMGLAFI